MQKQKESKNGYLHHLFSAFVVVSRDSKVEWFLLLHFCNNVANINMPHIYLFNAVCNVYLAGIGILLIAEIRYIYVGMYKVNKQ